MKILSRIGNSNVYDEILEGLCPINDEILECTLDNDSEEVAVTIAGYIAKKLAKDQNVRHARVY